MAPVKKPVHKRAPTFLRQWRKHKGLTQEEVAEQLSVDTTTVGRIEKGELPYNQDYLERIAIIFGVDVTDLLAVNPLQLDPPKVVYDRLRHAPAEVQNRAIAIIEALLAAG
jgi:transcriptional regulator with XRE-family HTH domain